MKQKDVALIIVVVVVSLIFSLLLSGVVFSPAASKSQKVEVVEAIKSDFPTPDKKYFNDQSLDPTQLIKIGDTSNNNPFNSTKK